MVKWFKSKHWPRPKLKTLFIKVPLIILGGVCLIILLMAVLFYLPATRSLMLNKGMAIAGKSLPGDLSWAEARWSKLGYLELTDLHWVAAEEQGSIALVDLNRLAISFDLSALRQKDIRIQNFEMSLEYADVPAVLTAMGLPLPPDSTRTSSTESTEPAAFPRSGCVPDVPSLALETGLISATKIILPEGLVVSDLELNLMAEAGYGKNALFGMEHLAGNLFVTRSDTSLAPFMVALSHAGTQIRWLPHSETVVLDSLSVVVAAAGNETLFKSWESAGPVRFSSTGQVSLAGGYQEGNLDCLFTLPDAKHFNPFIAEGVSDELVSMLQRPVVGTLSLTGKLKDDHLEGQLELDLERTSWLEKGLIHLDLASPLSFKLQDIVAHLDTLELSLLGTHLQARADLEKQALNWYLNLDIPDASLAQLFAGEAMRKTDIQFRLDGQGGGTLANPQVDIVFSGNIDSAVATVPHLAGKISGGRNSLVASIRLDGPINAGGFPGDSLQLDLSGNIANPDSLVTDFGFRAWAPEMMASIHGQARRDTVQEIRLDSLVIAAAGLQMRLPQQALVRVGPGPGDFRIDGFAMEGEPGSLTIDGHWNETGLGLQSNIDLFLPEDMLQVVAPSTFWALDGGKDVSLAGNVVLGGTAQSPQFDGSLDAKLLPHRDEPALALGVTFNLDDGSSRKAGLGADFSIAFGDSVLLHGGVQWPGQMDMASGTWVPAVGDSLSLQVPEQYFDLGLLNRVMPADVKLQGDLNVAAEAILSLPGAEGISGDINGLLQVERVKIDLPNRSRVELGLDLTITGTVADPAVVGKVDIQSGFFRIPELPKTLHPTKGTSLLWDAVKNDSLQVARADLELWRKAAVADSLLNIKAPVLIPDLDLVIRMPGNFRVHGYGVDMELGGDLKVKRGADSDGVPMPVITGAVEIMSGTLRFMNHMFTSQKGEITFAGHAPANPILDLKLEAEVESYLIGIGISGPAIDPIIDLTSEPEMNEVDILAILFFGQPANDLDNDQRGHMNEESDPGQQLRENLAGLAMVFGTVGLSNAMSNTLGVDMLEVGSDSSGDSTLMVGKFLTPKIMLKYHQSLEKSGSNFMTLEYSLSRFFKLMSSYGQGDEPSGLELGFTKRY